MHAFAQIRFYLLELSLALLGDTSFGYAASPQAGDAQGIATQEAFKQATDAELIAIAKEDSTTPGVAWAGDYYFGGGLGENVPLSLAPIPASLPHGRYASVPTQPTTRSGHH